MIKNIIFDWGDVLLPLNINRCQKKFAELGISEITPEWQQIMENYEKGEITSPDFLNKIKLHTSKGSISDIQEAWESMIDVFPIKNIYFLKKLQNKYNLFLLSNTNDIHLQHIQKIMGTEVYQEFYNSFKQIYFSHQINMRKPDDEIFQKVLSENNLITKECLFIDDREDNIIAAKKLGINTWHLTDRGDLYEIENKIKTFL